ncbi:MAG: hypothetical protein QG653_147 [Patescibacteria group bacterium]|nr:hypothetical protein [Patescibacteria group bacterium]
MPKAEDTIEQALAMYKETVSPSRKNLQVLLSQIPEQTKLEGRRAIRSPYRWLFASQFVSLCLLAIAIIPAYLANESDPDFYFRSIDKEVSAFETQVMLEDYNDTLLN